MFINLPLHIMPGLDGTGPQGQGPLSGRGGGSCASQGRAGQQRGRLGRGRFGRMRGWFGVCPGSSWYDPDTLEEAEKELEKELEAVRKERESQKKK